MASVHVGPSQAQDTSTALPVRAAGAGGLLFVALVVVQNALRASAPGFDSTPDKVAAYFVDHRAAAIVPLGLFPIAFVGLAGFTAGVCTRARRADGRWWAVAGALGVALIAALFAVLNVIEIVLAAQAHRLTGRPDQVDTLWAMHSATFGLNLAAIAVALVGLSRAALSADLIPGWLAVAALPGAACLLVAAVFAVAITEGAPWLLLGLVGFVVWAVFVVVASARMLRSAAS